MSERSSPRAASRLAGPAHRPERAVAAPGRPGERARRRLRHVHQVADDHVAAAALAVHGEHHRPFRRQVDAGHVVGEPREIGRLPDAALALERRPRGLGVAPERQPRRAGREGELRHPAQVPEREVQVPGLPAPAPALPRGPRGLRSAGTMPGSTQRDGGGEAGLEDPPPAHRCGPQLLEQRLAVALRVGHQPRRVRAARRRRFSVAALAFTGSKRLSDGSGTSSAGSMRVWPETVSASGS